MPPRSLQLLILGLGGAALPIWAFSQITDTKTRQLLGASAVVSALGFLLSAYLVPRFAKKLASRGICGKDLNKKVGGFCHLGA